MEWKKKGLLFSADEALRYGISNTQVPYAFYLNDECLRIFFGARKGDEKSASVYYIDVDPSDPQNISAFSSRPVLEKGSEGCFDQDGVLPVCVKKWRNDVYLYYGGFTKHGSKSHNCMLGLAISKDNGNSFEK